KDCITNRRGQAHDGSFARAHGRLVLAIQEERVHRGNIAEARDAIFGEAVVQDAYIVELDGLEQCSAEAHDVSADDLIAKAIGIYDGAAVEGRQNAQDFDISIGGGSDFHKGRDISELFVTSADAVTVMGGFGSAPAEFLCALDEYGAKPFFFEVQDAKFQGIHLEGVSDFVHVNFAGKMVCGGSEAAIRALAKRRLNGVELDELVGHVIV